jgi:Chitobiase/beta-hexosaminidase C-terminal domain
MGALRPMLAGVKLRATLLALLIAVAIGVGSADATVSNITVTLTESSPFEAVAGSTLFYAPTGSNSGNFTVTASASTTSTLTSVDFQAIPGMASSGSDSTAPYQDTYSWTASTSASGPFGVTVHDSDPSSLTAAAAFTVTPDTTAPTGQTVALSGGPNYSALFVPLVLTNGSDAGAGLDTSSGIVERASASLTAGTCGSFGAFAPVTLTSGGDATVVSGNCYRYQYKISDLVGNQSAASASSADAKVNSVGPAVTLTAPTEVSGVGDQFWNGSTKTVYFRPAATGSFTLNATATDSVSSIAQVAFPDVSSVSGWSGATGGVDTTSPYASPVVYTWTAGGTAPGAKQVVATNITAMTASDTVTIAADSAPPSGQSVTLTGGPWFGTSVPLTVNGGTDGGSGVDAGRAVVERASATLTNGVCGTFGTYAAVTLSSGADTTVASGTCYRYQIKAADNVGNVSAASQPSSDAKVDRTPPSTPALFFSGFTNTAASGTVVYYRPGGSGSFTVTAASSDPESGVTTYSFPAIAGFTAAGSGPRRTYAFSHAGSVATAPFSVTATNAAGLSSGTASFRLVGDATPPALLVRCNGSACSKKAYAKTVTVTLSASDAVSGLDSVRWTSDGTDPTVDHGNQYLKGITVNGLTHLKIRAFDKAGNGSPLVNLTVASRASKLRFGVPSKVVIGPKAKYLSLRVTSTRRASVRLTMTGTGLKKPARWSFILDAGTSIVRVRLPKGVKHPGSYRVVWSLRSGTGTTTRSTRLTLRR